MNGNSFIKEIGRSYIVSSFLPAALFVSLGTLLFRGFVPKIIVDRVQESSCIFGNLWILMLIFTLWVAFLLFSSVDWTVKLFEGYKFPKPLQERMKSCLRKRWREKIAPNYDELQNIKDAGITKKNKKRFKILRNQAKVELQDLELQSPIDSQNLLPTRLGNALLASEVYAYERYQLEGITIWPRLFHVLPPQFIKDLEEKHNHLLFLLHSALLLYINAAICMLVGLFGSPCQIFPMLHYCNIPLDQRKFFLRGFTSITPLEYILIGSFLIGFGYVLYRIAVNAAIDFGLFVRAGFDLYRFNLLKQLNQKLPTNLDDERRTWGAISEFFIAGNRLGVKDIKYKFYYYGDRDIGTLVNRTESTDSGEENNSPEMVE